MAIPFTVDDWVEGGRYSLSKLPVLQTRLLEGVPLFEYFRGALRVSLASEINR